MAQAILTTKFQIGKKISSDIVNSKIVKQDFSPNLKINSNLYENEEKEIKIAKECFHTDYPINSITDIIEHEKKTIPKRKRKKKSLIQYSEATNLNILENNKEIENQRIKEIKIKLSNDNMNNKFDTNNCEGNTEISNKQKSKEDNDNEKTINNNSNNLVLKKCEEKASSQELEKVDLEDLNSSIIPKLSAQSSQIVENIKREKSNSKNVDLPIKSKQYDPKKIRNEINRILSQPCLEYKY